MNTAIIRKKRRAISVPSSHTVCSFLVIIGTLLGASCDESGDGKEPVSSGKPACLVSKQTNTASGQYDATITYVYKSIFTYRYDDDGNVIESTVTYNYNYSDGKTSAMHSTTSYQYDDDGFLIRSVRQYNSTDRDGRNSFTTSNEDLTYDNGRLTKHAYVHTDNGKVTNYALQYEYNSDGRVIRYINTYDNSLMSIEYNGSVVVKVTRTDAVGTTTSPFLQYNDKGWLVKAIETSGAYTDEYRYEYTTEGLLSREERYLNGKPSSGNIYEYDTKENPSAYVYGPRKGFPKIPSTRPEFLYTHNYIKYTALVANDDMTGWKNGSSSLYLYDYNDKGFPTGYTVKSVKIDGSEASTGTSTFEYENCP